MVSKVLIMGIKTLYWKSMQEFRFCLSIVDLLIFFGKIKSTLMKSTLSLKSDLLLCVSECCLTLNEWYHDKDIQFRWWWWPLCTTPTCLVWFLLCCGIKITFLVHCILIQSITRITLKCIPIPYQVTKQSKFFATQKKLL